MATDELDIDAIREQLEERRDQTRERVERLAARPELGSAQGFGKRVGDGTTEAVSRLTEIGVGESLETTLEWDHDHCDFCWAKFMAPEIAEQDSEILGAGYTVASQKRSTFWICPSCFEDFKERFAWTVVPSEGAG